MNTSSTRVFTSNKRCSRLNSIENSSSLFVKSTRSNASQTDPIEQCSKSTNTPNYFDEMLIQGQKMKDEEFEKFLQGKTKNVGVRITLMSNFVLCSLNECPQGKIFGTLEEEIRSPEGCYPSVSVR